MTVRKIGQDTKKELKATCKNCGAILAFYPKDVKSKSATSFDDTVYWSYVVCVECKNEVTVKDV